MEKPNWPRVRIPIPPCPPGLSLEETEQAMLAICQPLWGRWEDPRHRMAVQVRRNRIAPPPAQQ